MLSPRLGREDWPKKEELMVSITCLRFSRVSHSNLSPIPKKLVKELTLISETPILPHTTEDSSLSASEL